VFLIADGHPAYRGKKVKAFVESTEGKLRFLPGYSPELNPDETVWDM
jgi:transposase